MRSLLQASLLLAPALAAAFVVPHTETAQELHNDADALIAENAVALIGVEVPHDSTSPDDWQTPALGFRLEVLNSEAACGYGNITLNGQALSQTLDGDFATGKGSISADRNRIVSAKWSFHCIKVNGQPDSQFLTFNVNFVDGKAVEDVGFSMLFRQSDSTEILNIETDLSLPDHIVANPNPERLLPSGESTDLPQYSVEQDIAELDWMRAQLEELKYLIHEKEKAIAEHATDRYEDDIKDCDSLKCVVKAVADQARHAAHKIIGKLHGHDEEFDEEFGHFPKPPFKKPQWPKNPFHHRPKDGKGKHGKPGNHTCGPPKHGKGNHTHPHPPPFKKPHFPHHRPLPICRYPPPPHHRPHHRPPPPPHHGKPPGGPPAGHGPEDRPAHPPHGGPDHGPEDRPPPPPPGHEPGPPPPPPHYGEGPPDHMPPPDHRFGEDQGPIAPAAEDDEEGPRGPPRRGENHHGGPPIHLGRPPRHGLGVALHIVKFAVIGCLFAFLVIALHRRTCSPAKRVARQARKEERRRRRAYRRAAHKQAISNFLARFSGHGSDGQFEDYEGKREALLADAGDGMSSTMTEDIAEFRNAAAIVGDLVAAEEGRSQNRSEPISITPSETSRSMRDYEIGSQVGDGEELPAYEDNDGSEASSFVADGFRYTPGSTEYTPSNSPSGLSDILGPDTKQ